MDVTLFEIHLDGAQFGPASIGDATDDDETIASGALEAHSDEHGPDEGSRSFARRVLPFVPVAIAFVVVVRYAVSRRSGGDALDADAESVEIAA